jgi:hypothetical protein
MDNKLGRTPSLEKAFPIATTAYCKIVLELFGKPLIPFAY